MKLTANETRLVKKLQAIGSSLSWDDLLVTTNGAKGLTTKWDRNAEAITSLLKKQQIVRATPQQVADKHAAFLRHNARLTERTIRAVQAGNWRLVQHLASKLEDRAFCKDWYSLR